MRSRYSDYADDRDERSRPTRFWGGAERARESEASGSIGDESGERYGERYRSERRQYPQPAQSPYEAERYYGRQETGGRYQTSPQYGGRYSDEYSRQYPEEAGGDSRNREERGDAPDWSRGYAHQGFAGGDEGLDSGGAWTGRRQYPAASYGRDRNEVATGHRGKGPKGYERTDERLKEIICERLTDDDSIDASNVSVKVASGRVTLDGTVDSRRAKYDVEECAEQCGAREIVNNLRIERSAAGDTGNTASGTQRGSSSAKESAGSKGH